MLNLKWNFIVLFLRVDLNLLWHSRLVLYKTFWFQKSWKFSYYVPSMDKMNNGPPELVPFELLHLELGTMAWQFISRRDWLIDGWSFYVWLMDGWQCCGSRSGAFLTPGSGKGFFSGSRNPNPYFWDLGDNFWGKKYYKSWWICSSYFLYLFENNVILSLVKFEATKKGKTTNFPPSIVAAVGSGIRDG